MTTTKPPRRRIRSLLDRSPTLLASALALSILAPVASTQADDLAGRGRALFVDHGCVHCHDAGELELNASPRGPILTEIGSRLRRSWIARWLTDPSAVHPDARMPAMFEASEDGARDARDVAAYLASLGEGKFEPADWSEPEGEALFYRRGCAACHGTEATDDGRHALLGLGQKTGVRELADYLRSPLKYHPAGRMPDLNLSEREARVLAAYLWNAPDTEPAAVEGDADRGASLVSSLGCVACHDLPAGHDPRPAPVLQEIAGRPGGCLTGETGLPRYAFSDGEREALRAFLADPAAPETAAARADRRIAQLRCTSCHERDGAGGMSEPVRTRYHEVIQVDALDHAQPPSLTDLHQRLRPEWVDAALRHRVRARPYMELRMPHYSPALTEGLAALLAGEPTDRSPVDAQLEDIANGRALVGSGGFSCTICHDFAGQPSTGSRAPDLAHAYERLQPDYLRRWITDPASVRIGTRMPTYFPGAYSGATHILEGRTDDQVAAIIAYLSQGERATPPEGMGPVTDATITVADRALVYRTILPELSPRSLALGFPDGLSAAFDVQEPRFGYAWQGGFVDLSRKWTGRGDGPCDLVGSILVHGPDGSMFVRDGEPIDASFAGYRLTPERVELRFDLENSRVTLAVDVVRSSAAVGLRVRGTSDGLATDVVLGEHTDRTWAREARLMTELRAEGQATCWLLGATKLDGDRAGIHIPASGAATGVLWFPTSRTDDTAQEVMAWRD